MRKECGQTDRQLFSFKYIDLKCGLLTVEGGLFHGKIDWFLEISTQLHIRENHITVLSVNIRTHGVAYQLLELHSTPSCVYIFVYLEPVNKTYL